MVDLYLAHCLLCVWLLNPLPPSPQLIPATSYVAKLDCVDITLSLYTVCSFAQLLLTTLYRVNLHRCMVL